MRISTSQLNQQAVNAMLDQQAKLAKTQLQISTGNRILTPSDDPAGASRALGLDQRIAALQQFQANGSQANSRLALEDSTLSAVQNVVQRLRQLAVQANNDSLAPADRQSIGAEVSQDLQQLVEYGNTSDGNGEHIFAGNSTRTRPFVANGPTVSYVGDQNVRSAQVGPSRTLPVAHTGLDVFMRIAAGNGEFIASPDSANTGNGIVDAGSVQNPAASTNYPYTIQFGTNASGDTYYTVTDGGGGYVVPASGVVPADAPAYQPGADISFDGRQVSVSGTPAAGDSFTVTRAGNSSLFATVQDFADQLNSVTVADASRAQFHSAMNRILTELDAANGNLDRVRAETGARMNAVDSEAQANDSAVTQLKSTLSQTRDLDYASAVSKLNLQTISLQAAQQSFQKVQGLSLFNYLK